MSTYTDYERQVSASLNIHGIDTDRLQVQVRDYHTNEPADSRLQPYSTISITFYSPNSDIQGTEISLFSLEGLTSDVWLKVAEAITKGVSEAEQC